MQHSWIVLVLLAVSVGACGRESPRQAAPNPAPAHSTPTTGPANTPVAKAPSEPAPAASTETDAASNEEPGTASLERLAALPAQQQLPEGHWKAGVNFDPIVPAQPTNVANGKVEVLEVFWFGCPHCYALEPTLAAWRQHKADYIEFVRVPVMWGPVHRAHARLFYTLQALGRRDLEIKVFDTIHKDNNMLVAANDNMTFDLQAQFAKVNGIDADAFKKAYESFGVNANLQRAEDLTHRYQVDGVPLIVVNGKYATDVGKAGNPEQLIALINDLAAGEHRH